MIAGRGKKHLRFVLQPTECLAVNDAITVALKSRPDIVFDFRMQPSTRGSTLGRLLRKKVVLAGFELLSQRHEAISRRKLVP